MLAAASARLGAQSYLLSSPGPGSLYSPAAHPNSSVDILYPIGYYNLGYEFTTGASGLSVSALGFYDAGSDGLTQPHVVGLWDVTSQSLLASANFTASVYPLINGFAYQPVSVTLLPNTNYILSAAYAALAMFPQDALRFNQSALTLAGGATLVGDSFGTLANDPNTAFTFPSGTNLAGSWASYVSIGLLESPLAGGLNASYVGANMEFTAVPEPSTYAAFAGLGMLGFAAWHRRRRQSPAAKLA